MKNADDKIVEMPVTAKPTQKVVKAMPTSPIYAIFDIVEVEGKKVVHGSVGFVDQFHMERLAKTTSHKGILGIGQHVLDIFEGKVDIIEPDDETKAKLIAAQLEQGKQEALNAYEAKPEEKK